MNLAMLQLHAYQAKESIAANLRVLCGGKEYGLSGPLFEWSEETAKLWAGWLTQPPGTNYFTDLVGDGDLVAFYCLEEGKEKTLAKGSAFEESRSRDKVIRIKLTRPAGTEPFFIRRAYAYGAKQPGEVRLKHHNNINGHWTVETGWCVSSDGGYIEGTFTTGESQRFRISGVCGVAVSTH